MKTSRFGRFSGATLLMLAAFLLAFGVWGAPSESFELHSPAVGADGKLPADFTCDGSRSSPPVEWVKPPAGTKSFALTMHHIPGPGDKHVYWVLYNIPADTRALAKNVADVGVRGINTVNSRNEYAPPCSKGPGVKKYTLTVYALSSEPKIDGQPSAVTMDMLLDAIKDRALGTAVLDVTYERGSKTGGRAQEPQENGPGAREPRGGPPVDRALRELTLSDAQKTKADPILRQYHEHMQQLREQREKLNDQLLQDLKDILDPQQLEKLDTALKQPPGPPPGAARPGDSGVPVAPPPPPPDRNENEPK
jgi:Raf kinase inhibitor-like YbhB/YbcL family protein